jgi:polyhydroxybutyrate depolymerase
MRLLALLGLLSLAACTAVSSADDDDSADVVSDDDDATPDRSDPALWPDTLGGDRTARVRWPSDYDGGDLPVVVQLHGYTGSGQWQWQWPNLSEHIDDLHFILVSGEGTADDAGDRFWNATEACCDFYSSDVDDVAWLTSVLDEVEDQFPVDTDRVYFTGLSNGGFMSYRMACEGSARIAAIASVAGMDYLEDDACTPTNPVSVLQIHGTSDDTVPYDGWDEPDFHIPSARASVERWAGRAGCDLADVSDDGEADYVSTLAGAETTKEGWRAGCVEGRDAALWTMAGAEHVPEFSPNLGADLLGWLLSHEL